MKRILVFAGLATLMSCMVLDRQARAADTALADKKAEQAIRQLIDAQREASLRNDVAALDGILADDCIFTSSRGEVRTKDELLSLYKTGGQKFESIANDEIRVRIYGDTAVVTFRSKMNSTVRGDKRTGQYRILRVYVKRQNRWQLAAHQGTSIPEK